MWILSVNSVFNFDWHKIYYHLLMRFPVNLLIPIFNSFIRFNKQSAALSRTEDCVEMWGNRVMLSDLDEFWILYCWSWWLFTIFSGKIIIQGLHYTQFCLYSTTFAVLTNKLLQHGVYQMVSELHIIIRADVASTSVGSVDDRGATDSFSLRSLNISGIFIITLTYFKYAILYKNCISSITLSFQACKNWKPSAFLL